MLLLSNAIDGRHFNPSAHQNRESPARACCFPAACMYVCTRGLPTRKAVFATPLSSVTGRGRQCCGRFEFERGCLNIRRAPDLGSTKNPDTHTSHYLHRYSGQASRPCIVYVDSMYHACAKHGRRFRPPACCVCHQIDWMHRHHLVCRDEV